MGRELKISSFCILLLLSLFLFSACPLLDGDTLRQEPNISLYMHETGETVNLDLEEYLYGVVAAEMDPDWPLEALKAQAILARTFTMKKIENGGVPQHGTDASTDIKEFQAYGPDRITSQVRQAVDETRGEVVFNQKNYINGWFHADGGGKTAASALEGLGFTGEKTPYIHSVDDPGREITLPENRSWQASFSLEEVQRDIKAQTGRDPGQISSVEIEEKGPSGRITRVRVGSAVVEGPAFRLSLGSEEFRSTLIDELKVEDGKLVVSGQGYGHGVGLSQWGARAMAEEGKDAENIIGYFFDDVYIQKVWD